MSLKLFSHSLCVGSDNDRCPKISLRSRRGLKPVAVVTSVMFLINVLCQDMAFSARPTLDPSNYKKIMDGIETVNSPFSIETFQLPQNLGEIKDEWFPKDAGGKMVRGPVVIHVQDAHCNYAAQRKIFEIVNFFNKTYGVRTVNLEGGEGGYDLSIFAGIDDPKIRVDIADRLVRDGEIGGTELYAVSSPETVRLWGVEDPELYVANLSVYRETIKDKSTIDRLVKNISYLLTNLKMHIFSGPLIELDKKRAAFRKGNLDFKVYLEFLLESARKEQIALDRYPHLSSIAQVLLFEKGIDFKKAEKERDRLIDILQKSLSKTELEELVEKMVLFKFNRISKETVFKYISRKADDLGIETGEFPDFQKYNVYISTYESVNKSALYDEVKSLEEDLWGRMSDTADQKELFRLSDNLGMIEDFLYLNLTREKYKYYDQHRADFDITNFVSFIKRNAPIYKINAPLDENVVVLNEYVEKMEKFYEYSFQRDEAFIENIKFDPRSKLAVLVTGGFHTENLCELMRGKGISYISIMPKFQSPEGYESPYFRILGGELYGENEKIAKVLGIYAIAIASVLNMLGTTVRPREWMIDQLRIRMMAAIAGGRSGIEVLYGDKIRYFDGKWNELTSEEADKTGNFLTVSLPELAGLILPASGQVEAVGAAVEQPIIERGKAVFPAARMMGSAFRGVPRGFRGQAGVSTAEVSIGVFVVSAVFLAIFPYVSMFVNISSFMLGIFALIPITFMVILLRSAVQQFSQYLRSPFGDAIAVDENKKKIDAAAEEWLESMIKKRPYTNEKTMGGNALNEDAGAEMYVREQIKNFDEGFETDKVRLGWGSDSIKESINNTIRQLYPDETARPAEVNSFLNGLGAFTIELHSIKVLSGEMGIPKRAGAAFVIDQVPILAEFDPRTSTLNIYATDALIKRIDGLRSGTDAERSLANRLIAEVVDHEYAENLLGNTHAEAARRAKNFGELSLDKGLSPYHQLILDEMAKEGDVVSLLYFLNEPQRGLRTGRDVHYENQVFRAYITDHARPKALEKFYDRVFLSNGNAHAVAAGILNDIQNVKKRTTYKSGFDVDRKILEALIKYLNGRIAYVGTLDAEPEPGGGQIMIRGNRGVDISSAAADRIKTLKENVGQAESVREYLKTRLGQGNIFEERVPGFKEKANDMAVSLLAGVMNISPTERSQIATASGFFMGGVIAFVSFAFGQLDLLPVALVPVLILPVIGLLSAQPSKGGVEFLQAMMELGKGFADAVSRKAERIYLMDVGDAMRDLANFYEDNLRDISLRQIGFSKEISLIFAGIVGFCQFITHDFNPVLLVGISFVAGFLIPLLQGRTAPVLHWLLEQVEDIVEVRNKAQRDQIESERIKALEEEKKMAQEEKNRINQVRYQEIYREMDALRQEMTGLVIRIGEEKKGMDISVRDKYLRPGADRLSGHIIRWKNIRNLCASLIVLITEQNNSDPGRLAEMLRSFDTDKTKISIAHTPGAIRFQHSQLLSLTRSDIPLLRGVGPDVVSSAALQSLKYNDIVRLLQIVGENSDKAVFAIENYLESGESQVEVQASVSQREVEKGEVKEEAVPQKSYQQKIDEIIVSIQRVLSLARFPEQQIISYMPKPEDVTLENTVIKNERSVRKRLDEEYGMGKVRVCFFDAGDSSDITDKLDLMNDTIKKDPNVAIMVYVPENMYEVVTKWAQARDSIAAALADNKIVFIKEAFDEKGFSRTMVGVHAAIAISVFAMLLNESPDYKSEIADSFQELLSNVGATDAAEAFSVAIKNDKLGDALTDFIKGKMLLEIKPLSGELSEQLEAIEAIAKSL